MSMTSPEDIENWFEGTQLYDAEDIEGALNKFREVTQNSRILFNVGCCYLAINDIKAAAKSYKGAVENDQHLAVGYFMVGLTTLLLEEYESAMTAFKKSLELLRGNRCVDYKQLGLNYQLYSCEIISNQAVIAYQLNQFDKAKEYLLEAVGCKAEPRHEATLEMLEDLQNDIEITPYVLPKNRIFRPPKSYVQNLKKKDYLGKAKVITTENEEDIYACFSGIKDAIMQARREKEANNKKAGENEKKSRAMNRSIMLSELRKPDMKKSLRKTITRKSGNADELGKIVQSPQESNDASQRKDKRRPKSPCPPRRASAAINELNAPRRESNVMIDTTRRHSSALNEYHAPRKQSSAINENHVSQKQSSALSESNGPRKQSSPLIENYAPRKQSPVGSESHNSLQLDSTGSNKSPFSSVSGDEARTSPYNKSSESDSADESPYETITKTDQMGSYESSLGPTRRDKENPLQILKDKHQHRLSVPEVIVSQNRIKNQMPKIIESSDQENALSLDRALQKKRYSTTDIDIEKERRINLTIMKPLKKPPPLMKTNEDEEDELSTSVSSIDQLDSGIDGHRKSSEELRSSNSTRRGNNKTKDLNKKKVKKERKVEVEIQYTFVKKLRVPVGCDLDRLQEIVKSVRVPDQVELCYQDRLGRQRALSDEDLEGVLFRPSKPHKLFCYPEI